MPRANGPFEVLEKINDKAYKADLPGDYCVSATFNVSALRSYLKNDHLANLRPNFSKQGENDEGPSNKSKEDPQISPSNRNSQVQAQDCVNVLQMHTARSHGFDSLHVPSFVHVIS